MEWCSQEEGIVIAFRTSDSNSLPWMLRLILKENSFYFNGKDQTHGTAMGIKMAVSFANIFMAEVETDTINQSPYKPLEKIHWRHLFSMEHKQKAINNFTELPNSFHPTIKFTAEISDTEITFLDTRVYKEYKGDRLNRKSTLFLIQCAHAL